MLGDNMTEKQPKRLLIMNILEILHRYYADNDQ